MKRKGKQKGQNEMAMTSMLRNEYIALVLQDHETLDFMT